MRGERREPVFAREKFSQGLACACLLGMAGLALAGPSGLFAWSENNGLLAERQSELKLLKVQRDELRNRVALVDPRHVDPDLAGELLRSNLNVVHPDEMVMMID